MNSARVSTIVRLLRRRPVSRRAAEMAITLLEELDRELSAMKASSRQRVATEESDSGDDQVSEDDDVIVNADRLADPSTRR